MTLMGFNSWGTGLVWRGGTWGVFVFFKDTFRICGILF